MPVVNAPADTAPLDFLRAKALNLRRHMLVQAAGKGQGYLGQGFGIADFLAVLYFYEMRHDAADPGWADRDRFYLSTGHYSIALWAALAEADYFDRALLPTYGADGSPVEMSTIEGRLPGVEMTGGSLGHGLGIATGVALGHRIAGRPSRTFVEISDGELQEGSTWEAATAATSFHLSNLVAFCDCNGIQADGPMVVDIEPVAGKWRAFGWDTVEINGNDMAALVGAMHWARADSRAPKMIVMRTTPGFGVRRLVQREKAHFVRIGPEEWNDVANELEAENG
ncbi:transketolase (plasmid) [Roseomonas sp. CCTCC AB2023176]|uniref:transketolase n=1 Tax=Roseomonas sp. CCTCC AB2023176 TaxID=3342640 RepID=UPI0035D55C61